MPTRTPEEPGPLPELHEEAFGSWYGRHWERSRRLAAWLCGDPEDGADIAASVLVDVWSRWRVAGVPDAPEAYLSRAIRNRAATHLRRRDRERAATSRLRAHASAAVPSDPVLAVGDRDAVEHLLARLSDDERRTVALLYLDDLPCDEAAQQLGIRPATVRSRVHRTRRRLAGTAA
jgi:RNA polymerase sigma-70 factor, ECF subfamily